MRDLRIHLRTRHATDTVVTYLRQNGEVQETVKSSGPRVENLTRDLRTYLIIDQLQAIGRP